VKLDSGGTVQWQKVFGGNGDEIANSIAQTSDGGYAFVATTSSSDSGDVGTNHGNTDIWVVKLDPTGTIQWTKLLGGSGWDFTSPWFDDGIQQTSNGGYVIIGTTASSFSGDVSVTHGSGDVWIVKLDNTGDITWQNVLGGSDTEYGISIKQAPDNGYIFDGVTYSSNSGDVSQSYGNGDYWVGKLDPDGNLQWQQPLGGSEYDQPESIQPTSDGGYIVSGRSSSNNSGVVAEQNHGAFDAWVVKLTPRLTVNVVDSDTGQFIPDAHVGLYDYQHNTSQNLTTSSYGPVAFIGAVGSNPFIFQDSSVFGLSVSAEGYPPVSENVTFRITNQTVNVPLTAFTRPSIGQTYSMTMIQQPGLGNIPGSLYPWGSLDHAVVQNWLENKSGWSNAFYDTENSVTQADFGTNDQGLNNAVFHYHMGHGHTDLLLDNGAVLPWSYIVLSGWPNPTSAIHPDDVRKKWGGKNKWVFIDSCNVLVDKQWGGALNTSHGILGYSSFVYTSTDLPNAFFYNAITRNESVVQSYYEATMTSGAGPTATIIFATPEQIYHDHLPGHGTIAPDESPDNNVVYYADWCARGCVGQ
jgi:hypothetical protein